MTAAVKAQLMGKSKAPQDYKIGQQVEGQLRPNYAEMAQGKTFNWLGFAVSGKEFDAMRDLEAYQIAYWRGVRVEFERRGKDRTAEPYEYPALRNYLFIRPTTAQVGLLTKVRFLGGTFLPLSPAAVRQLEVFQKRVDDKKAEADRIAGNRKAIADYAEFKPGDELEIREGALMHEIARFVKLIQRAHDIHPVIQAEVNIMGRTALIDIDPLSVRTT